MEDDEIQRPYSVLTRDDLKKKMNKQINDISEIFCVSKSEATALLMKHRWNSQLLAERLCQEDKKPSADDDDESNQDLSDSDSSCDGVDGKVSTPFCKHEFSIAYWSKYLEESMRKYTIPCPFQGCQAEIERDAMQNLTVNKKNRYDEYVLRSYLKKRKKQIKKCPARGCSYSTEFHQWIDDEEYGLNVVCLCGHTFCWRCRLESHNPVTCNNASDWLSRYLEKLSVSCNNETNTKPCPHCQSPLEIFRGSRSDRFVPCVNCSGLYCWECMQSKESHETESGSHGDCVEPVTEQAEVVDTSCLNRWKASEVSVEEARSELRAFEESNNMVLREGLMLIVQCRQFLKWSCVYEYICLQYEDSRKEFLRFLQDYASTLVQNFSETLKEETEKGLSESTFEEVTCSRDKLSAVTSSIGNYFFNFSKALHDGLDVVEVSHYDDFSPCWLCDRCTYANTWLHKACQMCYDETPVEKPSDSFLN